MKGMWNNSSTRVQVASTESVYTGHLPPTSCLLYQQIAVSSIHIHRRKIEKKDVVSIYEVLRVMNQMKESNVAISLNGFSHANEMRDHITLAREQQQQARRQPFHCWRQDSPARMPSSQRLPTTWEQLVRPKRDQARFYADDQRLS